MSQPSSMFVAGDIIKKILGAFFLGHPVGKMVELPGTFQSKILKIK